MCMINKKARSQIEMISNNLSDISEGCKRTTEYKRQSNSLLNNTDVNWTYISGKRIICGLSRTINGVQLTDDFTSCIVKFETHTDSWRPKKNHNHREIDVWEKAKEVNNKRLFGSILDYANDGKWLVMKKYIPVFDDQIRDVKGMELLDVIDEYIIKNESSDFIYKFKSKMKDKGWIARDLRGGNIGYNPNNDQYVLIDYGSSISYNNQL